VRAASLSPFAPNAPTKWKTVRIDRMFKARRELPTEDDQLVSAFIDGQVTARSNRPGSIIKNSGMEHGYKRIKKGDLAISGMNAHLGGLGISDSDGRCSPVYLVLRPVVPIDSGFCSYLLRHMAMSGYIRSLVQTIRFNSSDFKFDDLKNFYLPMPSVSEQKAIADCLDQETARIDALIEKKQQMCDLVQLRRRALVELYLGEASFPKWKLARLLISNDGGVWGEDPTGVDDTVVLRSTDISITGDWNIDNPALRSLTQSEKRAKTLKQGDLVVVKSSGSEAHLGKTAIVNSAVADLSACYANFVQRLRPRDTEDAKFLWYFLNSDLASKELDRLGNTTTGLRNLNGESLGSIKCPWPDHEIRNTLCQELDRRIITSNSLLSALEGQIALLRERRQALITAVVTGDLKIAEVAA
jgi:restriction endonuclease S subunit